MVWFLAALLTVQYIWHLELGLDVLDLRWFEMDSIRVDSTLPYGDMYVIYRCMR